MSPWSKAAPFGSPSRTSLLGRLSRGCIAPKLSRGTLGFPGSSAGKESTYNAGDLGLITGSGRSPGEGMAIHSSILAWKVPWMEEPGGLHPMGLQSQA